MLLVCNVRFLVVLRRSLYLLFSKFDLAVLIRWELSAAGYCDEVYCDVGCTAGGGRLFLGGEASMEFRMEAEEWEGDTEECGGL